MIYAIRNPRTKSVKIGYSREPGVRLKGLQTANEDELVLEGWCHGDKKFEERIHARLENERVRGEWFRGPKTEATVALLTLMRGSKDEEEERLRRQAIYRMTDAPQARLSEFAGYIDNWDDSKTQEQVEVDIERILGWGSPFSATSETTNVLRCDRCTREFDVDLIVEHMEGPCRVECGCGQIYAVPKEKK